VSIAAYNHVFPINSELFLADRDLRRLYRRRVAPCLDQFLLPLPDRLIATIDTHSYGVS